MRMQCLASVSALTLIAERQAFKQTRLSCDDDAYAPAEVYRNGNYYLAPRDR
jgi:hypothetical protein